MGPPVVAPIGATRSLSAEAIGVKSEQDVVIHDRPSWWTSRSSAGSSELVPVPDSIRRSVQDLMNDTWIDVTTRDRKALGGGDRVQMFEVVQVNRNENHKLWQDYARRRECLRTQLAQDDLLSNVVTAAASPELGQTERSCNEFLLFHGTKPSAVSSIIENDFMLKLAGSHRGTLYGAGLYFAERSSKADEYAEDDKSGIYRGLYAMLLCRVTLGRSLYTDEGRPDGRLLRDACTRPDCEYHSVLGDREKLRGTYREFVVYSVAQAYPEYVVIYRRRAEST